MFSALDSKSPSSLDRIVLYVNTLRYVKTSQILWRLIYQIIPRHIDTRSAPDIRPTSRSWSAGVRRASAMKTETVFEFLNTSHSLDSPDCWNRSDWQKLWLYNLHYFDDLNAAGARGRREWHAHLIDKWIAENPPAYGVGWDSYPLSLRIVNWIKWHLSGQTLSPEWIHSLAVQARCLEHRLEYHLLGNHLFVNAKALVFAGMFFQGKEADIWLRKGLQILDAELREQILADGGHFERSPMYHALILEDLLDLIQLQVIYSNNKVINERSTPWHELATRMTRFLKSMCHPDGEIAFFNDAAFGIACNRDDLLSYARSLGVEVMADTSAGFQVFPETGYARADCGKFALLFDGAPVGPDYLPGHAHADTLSFELSYAGQRVICNSGTSTYEVSTQRDWERSTAAHNTVEVDSLSSSETWQGFRVARRARPSLISAKNRAELIELVCAHDGYRRLAGKPIHRRILELSNSQLTWKDEILGTGFHIAAGRIPIHPSIHLERQSPRAWSLMLTDGKRLLLESLSDLLMETEPGWYAPEFGKLIPRLVLIWRYKGPLPIIASFRLSRAD